MSNETLLRQLQPVWPGIEAMLKDSLHTTMTALVDAESLDTIRQLQGKARAYRSFLNLPQHLAALTASEEKD